MPQLPADAIPVVEFLVRHLYRPIDVGADARYFAISETEAVGEDSWFWSDDNAKVLELMSRPEIWRRFPDETAEILRFIRAMCRGPYVFRRLAAPRLEPIGTQQGITDYRHSLMALRHDPERRAVTVGIRFHDERGANSFTLAGNYVEFTYRGRRFKSVPRDAGAAADAELTGGRLRLRHRGEVDFSAGWQRRRLGEIVYTYTFDAASMLFEVEAVFDLDPGVSVSDVVMTVAQGGFASCHLMTDAWTEPAPLQPPGKPRLRRLPAAGAGYYMVRHSHISSDSLAIHSVPHAPQRLASLEVGGGRVIARYEFAGRHRGGRLAVAEDKLITAGGFYDRIADCTAIVSEARVQRQQARAACDFSLSYDYGVTINAFAKCFAVAHAGVVPGAPSPGDLHALCEVALQHYFERYVDRHERQPEALFSRELAFAALGVATMYRATGEESYRRRLQRLCEVLLDFEMRFADAGGTPVSAFPMRRSGPQAAFVDCHSAVLLALTQAARDLAEPRLATVIDRGLAGYGLETCRFAGGMVDTISTPMLDEHGMWVTGNAFWNFKAGLTLRFFAALRNSGNAALQAVAARHRERMELLETVLRRQLERSLVTHDDGVEIRCSLGSTETNSETQPWAMLGLVGHPFD